MLVKEFSGKSERDAINNALAELNLTEDQVRVEVIDKGKRSILGIGEDSPTIIRVFYEELANDLNEFQEIMTTVFKYMGINAEVTVREETEKRIYIDISTEDSGVLIGKKGNTLEALQFVISLIASKKFGDDNERHIILDVDGYRDRREETLKHMARQAAQQAKRTRRTVSLEPMSPYERRIIHLELQNDQDVETKSDGEPPYRSVRVYSKKKGGYNNKRYNDKGGYNKSYYRNR